MESGSIVVAPLLEGDAAIRLHEAVHGAIESHNRRSVYPDVWLTVGVGLWQWDGKATTAELLHTADTRLYEAKRGGRNRVA
jgi:GGDEF domain-containing protein